MSEKPRVYSWIEIACQDSRAFRGKHYVDEQAYLALQAELEKGKTELAWERQRHDSVLANLKEYTEAFLSEKKRNSLLIEALEFYADGKHLERPTFKNDLIETAVIDDGERARAALGGV